MRQSQHEGQVVVTSAGAVVDSAIRVRPGAVEVHIPGVKKRAKHHLNNFRAPLVNSLLWTGGQLSRPRKDVECGQTSPYHY